MPSDLAEDEVGLLSVVMPIRDDGRHVEALIRHWDSTLKSGPEARGVSFVLVDESVCTEPVERLAALLTRAGFQTRIRRQVPARGPGHARGQGLELVASDFVCFFDVDDSPDLEQFWAAAQIARRRALEVLALDYVVALDGQVVEVGDRPRKGHYWDDLLSRRAGVWRFIFQVDFLRGAGIGFPDWDYAEDLAFLLQCADRTSRIDYLPIVAYKYALHGQGLSGSRPNAAQAERAVNWLLRPDPHHSTIPTRYLRALWLARIAILGGWRTVPSVLPALPQLARNPLRVAALAGQAVRSRWTRRSSSAGRAHR